MLRSLRLQLITVAATNCEFGTMTAMLSFVSIVVDRMEIFTTLPATLPISTRSPSLMGRSKSMTRPLTTLFVMVCRPKPTPTPRAPKSMVRLLKSRPALWKMTMKPMVRTK